MIFLSNQLFIYPRCMCVLPACICVHHIHVCQVPYVVWKKASDSLGVELQRVVSHYVVLWLELRASEEQPIIISPDPVATFFKKKKNQDLMVSLTWTNNNCWKKSNAYFLSKLTELVMVIYKAFSILSLCYYLIRVLNWRNDRITISTLIGNMISSVCVLCVQLFINRDELFAWKTKSKVVKINVWVDIHW